MPLILSGNVATALGTGYDVDNSCRFDDGSSAYMHKTPGSAGSSRKVTISCWYKKAQPTNGTTWQQILNCSDSDGNPFFAFGLKADKFTVSSGSGSTELQKQSTQVLRDIGAWYHLCVGIDTTDGTAGDRVKMYINGTRVTSFAASTNPDQNYDFPSLNTTSYAINIGRDDYGGGEAYLDGYLAEVVFIDGSALAPTSFGEFDEDSPTIWKPKDVSGLTFGTNGFYLDFEDSSNLGNDKNGGADLTEVNLAATDQSTDTCTNNFATLNPLHKSTSNVVLSEGNLKVVLNQTTGWQHAAGTIAVKSGKWYWEAKALNVAATDKTSIGVLQFDTSDVDFIGNTNTDRSSKGLSGHGAGVGSYSYAEGEIVMCAMDIDNNKIYWGKDGTWFGTLDPAAGSGSTTQTISNANFCVPVVGGYADSSWELNFGNPQFSISSGNADANGYGNFEFAPPSGFLALCTKNLGSDGG
jgi:hypothetical protein